MRLILPLMMLCSPLSLHAGLGMSRAEAAQSYGPGEWREPATAAESFSRAGLSTNLTAMSEHTWKAGGARVFVGYETAGQDGEVRAVVTLYRFTDLKACPADRIPELLAFNAQGETWDERSLSPRGRERREYLRSDAEARFRAFQDAPEAIALSRRYDELVLAEMHRAMKVPFPGRRPGGSP